MYDFFRPNLEKEGLQELYNTVEEPLINVLAAMEKEGINLNADFLKNYSVELTKQISAFEKNVFEAAGTTFNLASPKQVGEVLFGKLEIPYRWRKTKTGQYSTDEEKMTELSADFPLVADILRHRGLTKLRSTYVDALPRMVNAKTGRIHSSFNQTIAATGRLSSKDPNLQNIPIRTPEGAEVRKAFIPRNEDYLAIGGRLFSN